MAKKNTTGTGSMTVAEAGRKGGEKVAEERGSEFYSKIGRMGGQKGGPRVRQLIEEGKRSEARGGS